MGYKVDELVKFKTVTLETFIEKLDALCKEDKSVRYWYDKDSYTKEIGVTLKPGICDWFEVFKHEGKNMLYFRRTYSQNTGVTKSSAVHRMKKQMQYSFKFKLKF